MAPPAETPIDIVGLALTRHAPREAMASAERLFAARRRAAPDLRGATRQALAAALGTLPVRDAVQRSAFAVADAVERHGTAFGPGAEPAYHDRHHQAEAVLAMGWLAGAARRSGLVDAEQAALGITAMVAHDLLHDGRVHGERGVLERRSAEMAAMMAAGEGLDARAIATLRRVVLATTWPWQDGEAPDLLCHMAREADLFGSTMPSLGPKLSLLLARELAASGQPAPEAVTGHVARLDLLRRLPPSSPPARALGLHALRQAQIDAYAAAARALALAEPTAEAGAAALDAMDEASAMALLLPLHDAP